MAAQRKPARARNAKISPGSRRHVAVCSLACLIAALCLAAGAYGFVQTRLWLRDIARYSRPLRVQMTAAPDWISPPAAAALASSVADIAPDATASSVASTILASSWVRSVKVRRLRDEFKVDVEFRRPRLAVAWGNQCCYVDQDGVALDPDGLTPQVGANCLTFEGIEARGVPQRGKVVGEPAVVAAASLVEAIRELASPLELDRVHVARPPGIGEPEFLFVTRAGARIVWGRRADDQDAKLARLRSLVEKNVALSPDRLFDLRDPR